MDFITPLSTTRITQKPTNEIKANRDVRAISSPNEALEALKDHPSQDTLRNVLNYLNPSSESAQRQNNSFSLFSPGPLSSQLAYVLVNTTGPDYWNSWSSSHKSCAEQQLYIDCLRSVVGLGALIARLRLLLSEDNKQDVAVNKTNKEQYVLETLDVINVVIKGNGTCLEIWSRSNCIANTSVNASLLWREYIAIVAGSRLLSTCAQATTALKLTNESRPYLWISDGNHFAVWLGQNIATMIASTASSGSKMGTATAQLYAKALSLGYTCKIT
jgi:telomere length regulation protein